MTSFSLLLAAIAVLPADRLAMADRLFNRAAYAEARREYAALDGEAAVKEDIIVYRLAECDRLLDKADLACREYDRLLERHPTSEYADMARLQRALIGSKDERASRLKLLDSDRVNSSIRAAALYHLGTILRDPAILARSVKVEPKGRYAVYARFNRAMVLCERTSGTDRREAISDIVEIAFDSKSEFAEQALYTAAVQCYRYEWYGEAGSLFHRYLKKYPESKRIPSIRTQAAWSDYLAGKYADARMLCAGGKADDLAYLDAMSLYATGDVVSAAKGLTEYLAAFPAGAYRENAELTLARIGFDDAVKRDDRASLLENAKRAATLSKSAADRLRLAWAYEHVGETALSEAEYRRLAVECPGTAESAEAAYFKAMADIRAGRWSAAELSLAEALATGKFTKERQASALYWRGIAALRLEHSTEGVGFLKRALEMGLGLDESREARLELADQLVKAGDVKAAKSAYLQLVRDGATARMSALKLHEVRRLLTGTTEALDCAKALIANSASEWRQRGYAALGEELEKRECRSAAIEAYRNCLSEKCAVSDESARAMLRLGILEFLAGELVAAENTLKRAVEVYASDPHARAEAYVNLAKVCKAKGDEKSARGYATVVVSLFDDPQIVSEAERILQFYHEGAK